MKKVLVIGGTGSLGRFICREVIRLLGAHVLVVGDYQQERGATFATQLGSEVSARVVNIRNQDSISNSLKGISAVIVAVEQDEPLVQHECMHQQIPCFDVSVHLAFVEQVYALDAELRAQNTLSLIMAGLFPGLSGIMAQQLITNFSEVSAVDVALLQNTQGIAGTTGIADMLGVFAQPVSYRLPNGTQTTPGFRLTRPITFPPPFGTKKTRLVNYPEASIVIEQYGVHCVNYWTGFDKNSFNILIAFLQRFGILQQFNHPKRRLRLAKAIHALKSRNATQSETVSIHVEVTGKRDGAIATDRLALIAPSDYGTTAMAVVAMTKIILQKQAPMIGARYPFEVFTLENVLAAMDCDDIILHQ